MNFKEELKNRLWESGIWETLNHDQLIELDTVVSDLFIKLIEAQEIWGLDGTEVIEKQALLNAIKGGDNGLHE